jgi:hypothetical protein
VVPHLAQALVGKFADKLDVGFVNGTGRILVGSLVAVALVGLRVGLGPGTDFVFVDTNLAIFEPGIKFWQRLTMVVFTDAGIHAVIPLMDPTNQVITRDITVGH